MQYFTNIILILITLKIVLAVIRLFKKPHFDLRNVSHQKILFFRIKRDARKAGYIFEEFVRDMLVTKGHNARIGMEAKKDGFYPPVCYKSEGDCGIDVIVESETEILLIQTKFYTKKLKKEIVSVSRDIHEIFIDHRKSIGDTRKVNFMIITNSQLDGTARVFAKEKGIKFMETHDLNDFIFRVNAHKKGIKNNFFNRLLGRV